MKRIILSSIFLLICASALLAQVQYKPQKYVYLWDVTYSMCGFVKQDDNGKEIIDPEKDIFDKVVSLLKKQIASKMDPNTTVVVCPFRGKEGLLETFTCTATGEGVASIHKEIDDFAKKIKTEKRRTNTDVISAIRQAKDRHITSNADVFLVILTDGVQNEVLNGNRTNIDDLCEEIKAWGRFAEDKDIFAYYCMLTSDAMDQKLKDTIDNTDKIDPIGPDDAFKELFTLVPSRRVSANIKDNKTAVITFKTNNRTPLPDDVKVEISADDDEGIIVIDDEFAIKNNQVEIPLKFRYPYDELKNMLPELSTVTLEVELVEENRSDAIIRLAAESVQLELINKPEKTLTVTIKR